MSKADWICRGLSRFEIIKALMKSPCARPVFRFLVPLFFLFSYRSTLCEYYVKYVSPFKN